MGNAGTLDPNTKNGFGEKQDHTFEVRGPALTEKKPKKTHSFSSGQGGTRDGPEKSCSFSVHCHFCGC